MEQLALLLALVGSGALVVLLHSLRNAECERLGSYEVRRSSFLGLFLLVISYYWHCIRILLWRMDGVLLILALVFVCPGVWLYCSIEDGSHEVSLAFFVFVGIDHWMALLSSIIEQYAASGIY
jgi:hypothetical protein